MNSCADSKLLAQKSFPQRDSISGNSLPLLSLDTSGTLNVPWLTFLATRPVERDGIVVSSLSADPKATCLGSFAQISAYLRERNSYQIPQGRCPIPPSSHDQGWLHSQKFSQPIKLHQGSFTGQRHFAQSWKWQYPFKLVLCFTKQSLC